MHNDLDPVDGALQSLRSNRWADSAHERILEEKLMQEFNANTRPSRLSKYRTLIVALVVVALGGVGFAASGGTYLVKRFLIKVELVGEDGSLFRGTLEPLDGEAESATIQVVDENGDEQRVEIQKLGPATLTGEGGSLVADELAIEFAEPGDAATDGTAGVTVRIHAPVRTGEQDGMTVLLEPVGGDSDIASSLRTSPDVRIVTDLIEPEESLDWIGDDGETHELSVVRNVGEVGGFTVFATVHRDEDTPLYVQVGALETANPDELIIDDIVITEDGFGIVTFVDENGKTIELKVENVESAAATANDARPATVLKKLMPRDDRGD